MKQDIINEYLCRFCHYSLLPKMQAVATKIATCRFYKATGRVVEATGRIFRTSETANLTVVNATFYEGVFID